VVKPKPASAPPARLRKGHSRLVEGSDPTGRPYTWRDDPCDFSLSKPTPEMVDRLFAAVTQ
jgi:hypothetical protein